MAFKRRLLRTSTAATVALATALALAPRAAHADCDKVMPNSSLRVMAYNASFQIGAPTAAAIISTVVLGPNPASGDSSDTSETYGMSDATRIHQIVDRIVADDPDVFSLEEVNKPGAKELFIKLLSGKWKSFIRDIGSTGSVELNDSGLMLFSKYNFLSNATNIALSRATPPPAPSDFGRAAVFINNAPVNSSGIVNVLVFGDAAYPDVLASKSVAVVKVLNECNGKPFTVAFTHLQNTYEDHDVLDQGFENHLRLQQFEDIRFAVSSSLSTTEMASEPVFVLGDLNVNGMANAPNFAEAGNGVIVPESHSEWSQTFNGVTPNVQNGPNPSGLFFSCGGSATCSFDKTTNPSGPFLTDGWGFGMPSTDFGQTNAGGAVGGDWLNLLPAGGQRIDYVLHNKPTTSPLGLGGPICLQYMKRGFEYVGSPSGSGAGVTLSDHMPLLADFNTPAPRCSPFPLASALGPTELTWPTSLAASPDLTFNISDGVTTIANKGNMQWYHIGLDQPGTYTIQTSPFMRAAVYQEKDLSREIAPVAPCFTGLMPPAGTASHDCKYSLPSPPYFIRVAAVKPDQTPDRSFSGPYEINFHKNQCKSMADSCHLEPAIPFLLPWPDNAALNASDTAFFDFDSENTSTGLSPRVTLAMTQTSSAAPLLTHTVIDTDGITATAIDTTDPTGTVPALPQTTWVNTGGVFSRQLKTADGALPGIMGVPAKFFYLVHRIAVGPTFNMTAQFNTDLTYFVPSTLQCREERTLVGDDDVWGHFIPDGVPAIACGGSPSLGSPNPDCVQFGAEDWNTNADDDPSQPRKILGGRHVFKSYSGSFNPQIFEDVFDNDDFLFTSNTAIPSLSSSVAKESALQLEYVIPGDPGAYDYRMILTRSHTKPLCTDKASDFCPDGTTCTEGYCK